MYKIKVFAITYQNWRENNEDNYLIDKLYLPKEHKNNKNKFEGLLDERKVFGVFDGLGGEAFGEVASYIAAKSLSEYKDNDIKEYYLKTDKEIYKKITSKRKTTAGTTAVILELDDKGFTCSNIGDSRCYIIRNGEIKQLSKVHTSLQVMIDAQILTLEQAIKNKFKNSLTQFLGSYKEGGIEPFIENKQILENNDIFLLCSDGLLEGLAEKDILHCIMSKKSLESMAEYLVNVAIKGKSKDNITLLLIKAEKERKGLINWLKEVIHNGRYKKI